MPLRRRVVTLAKSVVSPAAVAVVLLGAVTRGAAAQDFSPPIVSFGAYTGVFQSPTLAATVYWCDDLSLASLTRGIWLNGTSVKTSFSYVNNTQAGCGVSKKSAGTLTLAEGANTFSATICDADNNCGSAAVTYTYGVWLTPHTQAVSVAPFAAKQPYTFTVQNPTPTSKQYTFTVSCSGTVSSCQTPVPLTVGANSTATDTVYYNSGAAGTSGSMSVIAKGSANPAIADQLTATVTVTTPAQQLVVSPLYTNYDNHRVDLCAAGCFTARQAVSTVPYISGGQPRSTTLVYDGDAVAVRPVLSVDARVSAGALVLQEYWLEAKDSTGASLTFLNGETKLRFAAPATATSRVRLAGQFDAAALGWATGVYPVTLIVTAKYTSTATEAQTIGTKVLVVNERKSPIGRGWTVGGVSRVQAQGPDALIVEGGGSAVFFRGCGTGCYSAPPGDFSRLRTTGTGTGQMFYNDFPDSSRAEYNYLGQLTRLITRTLDSTVFEYDGAGRLTKIYDPYLTNAGAHLYTALQYGATGLAHLVEPSPVGPSYAGRTTDVTVAADSTLTAFRDPDSVSTQFGYDGSRRLSTVTNRRGDLTTVTYNATSWKLATTVSPSFPVDPRLYGANQTRQLTTTYRPWQTAAVPTTTTGTTPAPAVLTDTIRGAVTDAGGHVLAFTVNRWGQAMVTTALPGSGLARVDSVFRDSLNVQVTKVRRHEGSSDFFSYTGPLLMSRQLAGQNAVNIVYGAFGQVTQIWGSGIPTQDFKLGQRGRVDTAIVAGTYKTVYGYDGRQRVTSVKDPAGHTTTYHYDATFGTLDSTLAPGGRGSRVKFDAYGRDSASRAGTQPWRATQYDRVNRPTMVTLEAGGGLAADTTLTAYDSVGNVTRVTDPAHNVYQYQYNALGALTQQTDPALNIEKYFFDAEGAARSTINRRGDSVWADLDALHRPVAKTIKVGASVVRSDSLLYDPHGLWSAAKNAISQVTVYTDSTGWTDSTVTRVATDTTKKVKVRYTKDANARLDSLLVTFPGSIAATWRRYTWNSSTGTLAAVYVNGSSVNVGYDTELLPSTVTQPGSLTRNLSPSSIHQLFKAGYSTTGVDTLLWRGMELDSLGRVARQYAYANSSVNKTQYTYRFDPRGRLIAVHDSTLVGASTCDGVDFGVRLCSGYTPMLIYRDSLAYDRLGNATYANGSSSGTGVATYTTTSRITGWPGYTYAGDAAGNVTQRIKTGGATTNFYWSADGLLDSVIVGSRKIRYDYNAFGQLVRKRVDGAGSEWRHFFWDQGHLLAELDSALTSRVGEYAYFPGTDRPMAFLTGATTVTATSYFQQDVQGSVIGLTTSGGAVQSAVVVSRPWGEYEVGSPGVPTTERLRWQGLFYEGDSTQLYYVRARWYDPVTHRFLTQDPIGLAGGINPYVFAANDPINNSDPTGLMLCGEGEVEVTYNDNDGFQHTSCKRPIVVGGSSGVPWGTILRSWAWAEWQGYQNAWDPRQGGPPSGGGAGYLLGLVSMAMGTAAPVGGSINGTAAAVAPSANRIFSAKVLERMAEESGPFHNFPQAVGEEVFKAGQRTAVSQNYIQYTMRGVVNGAEGTYEIGVRPSASGRTEVITHWFFRPDPN